jgi:hypothetical protein
MPLVGLEDADLKQSQSNLNKLEKYVELYLSMATAFEVCEVSGKPM